MRSDISTAYPIYFLSAEMHSDTSHSARLKEMIVSLLTQRMIIILQREKKKSYFEVL